MSKPLPFIVIRLAEAAPRGNDLRRLARRSGFHGLADLLREHPAIATERVIRNVTPQKLLRLEQRARDSDYPPLSSLTSFWRLDCRRLPGEVNGLIKRLSGLPEIGLAYRQAKVSAPAPVLNPAQNPRFADQGYLGPAPVGVGVAGAWAVANGSGIRFADVEKSWLVAQEDLFPAASAVVPALIHGVNDTTLATAAHHGAAVLGIVVGRNNTIGTIGMAPGVTSIHLSSHRVGSADFHVTPAIVAAITGPLRAGDVLLLEVQRDANAGVGSAKWVATEFDNADFTAIRLASALGFIVVEAAGTAAAAPAFELETLPQFNPTSGSFHGDSGAIMVAGSVKTVPHSRHPSSNFGARVNCYAWGEAVATVSGGTSEGGEIKRDGTPAAASTPETERYTRLFGGSSAAAAIVAGAAILVQDVYRLGSPTRPAGGRLSPRRMRDLLSDAATCTEQKLPTTESIGRMPDLGSLVIALDAVPDLYIRDDVGDDGSVPSAGAVSVSPDVVVSKTPMTPAAAFAAGGTEVKRGQDNFVYVRVSNRNAVAAPGAEVRVYWSEVATLVFPSMWNPLNPPNPPLAAGAVAPADATVNVPPSALLVEAPRITWQQANLPPSGHYCFVARVHHPLDPEPDLASFTWDQFISLFGSLLGLWLLSGAQASAAGPSSSAIVPVSFERQTLAVTVQDLSTPPSATPRGWVTSFGVSESGATSPKGIDCGPECFASFDAGTVVTLWAIPFAGSVFEGWTGACSGGSICAVTMDRAQSVTARFDVPSGPTDIKSTFTVSRDGSGNGKVTSGPPGINCGSDCGTRYPSNVNVTLTATAAEGSHVAGWNGPCAGVGTASTCVVTVRTCHRSNSDVRRRQEHHSGPSSGSAGAPGADSAFGARRACSDDDHRRPLEAARHPLGTSRDSARADAPDRGRLPHASTAPRQHNPHPPSQGAGRPECPQPRRSTAAAEGSLPARGRAHRRRRASPAPQLAGSSLRQLRSGVRGRRPRGRRPRS